MTVARDDTVNGKRRDVGTGILDQLQASLRGTDLGDRGGNRTLQHRAPRYRRDNLAMTGGDHVNEIGIDEQR